jgi:hypothetical protein
MIDKLIQLAKKGFENIADHRSDNSSYALADYLMTGFAMFSLKDPSLAFYQEQYPVREENLRRIYGIESVPGGTALREGLDEVNPQELQKQFKTQMDVLRDEGVFEERKVLGKYTAVSVDGTGHYCSGKKGCPQCMVKNHRNGKQSFYHQMLGAVAVHPAQPTVFPVACEPIVKQDGSTKNDCELNASKRIIPQIRQALPREDVVAVFDALYVNGPHIKALGAEDIRYIIGTKGQTYVDVQVQRLRGKDGLHALQWQGGKAACTASYANGLVLNGGHPDVETNYLEYSEVDMETGGQVFFSTWATDIRITDENIKELVAVARSRWKIENETFNTLKNQGYHFGHNYGHGKKYLATNFAILTFLAFLVDQVAQHLDKGFQAAKEACKSFKGLWERVRSVFYLLPAMSMNAIYRFIVMQKQVDMPALE